MLTTEAQHKFMHIQTNLAGKLKLNQKKNGTNYQLFPKNNQLVNHSSTNKLLDIIIQSTKMKK